MSRSRPILVATLCAILVAFLGGSASQPGAWYDGLVKSSLTPPDWVFAPAWTLIYATCVFAAVRGWRAAIKGGQKTVLITLFAINAVLNVVWSVLFFALQRPDWALLEVAALWASVAALIVFLRKITSSGAIVLIPYLLWVMFAAYLNYQVVVLNPPFG
ncbi:MAG: TspO/MBR family protein [Pseudomonadota bacterium]|nr:TspO/MBR family protein [Pseudomonadota bacterium]